MNLLQRRLLKLKMRMRMMQKLMLIMIRSEAWKLSRQTVSCQVVIELIVFGFGFEVLMMVSFWTMMEAFDRGSLARSTADLQPSRNARVISQRLHPRLATVVVVALNHFFDLMLNGQKTMRRRC
jgi:phage-related holin